MLSILPQQMFDLIQLALWGTKEGEKAANFPSEHFGPVRFFNLGAHNAVHFCPKLFFILFDLYFGWLRRGNAANLSSESLYSIYQFWVHNAVHFPPKYLDLIRLALWGIKEWEYAANLLKKIWLFNVLPILGLQCCQFFPKLFLILFDLYLGWLRKGKMLPIFLKTILALFDLLGSQCSPFFPKTCFDLIRLALWGIKGGENAANFLKNILALFDLRIWGSQRCPFLPNMLFCLERFGSIWFIRFGFYPNSIFIWFWLVLRVIKDGDMLPMFLKRIWLYWVFQFGVRLLLWEMKKGENAANFSQGAFDFFELWGSQYSQFVVSIIFDPIRLVLRECSKGKMQQNFQIFFYSICFFSNIWVFGCLESGVPRPLGV